MITLVFSPQWFKGVDIIFEALAVIVTMLIAFYSFKLYRFSGKTYTNYKYLGLSFLAFAASFLAKIATNFVIYFHREVRQSLGDMIIKYNLVQKSDFFFQAGYDLHRFLMLLGLFGVYWLVSKSKDLEHQWLFAYMIFVIALFSFKIFYVFHLTAAVLLIFIARHYYDICFCPTKKRTITPAHLNFTAFFLLLLSQLVFIFVWANDSLYVVAEILQLLGFIIFLVSLMLLVFGHGKKKN